jgi:DNA-binding NtrC family response regulator
MGSIQIRVGESLADVEQRLILHTLSSCRTKDEAARILGVSTKTLYNKLRRYESEVRAAKSAAPAPTRSADARAN